MKIKVVVAIWYNDNSKEQIDWFMDQVNEYPEDYFNLVYPEFKVGQEKTEEETLTFYSKDEEGKPVQLPQAIIQRIINPGLEWEGTPFLVINHEGNEYEIMCGHIAEY